MEQAIVSAVTHDVSEAKVTVPACPTGPASPPRLFRELADVDVNVDMIVQNVIGPRRHRHQLHGAPQRPGQRRGGDGGWLDEIGAAGVTSDADIARVSIIGAGMKSNPGVAATMFEALAGPRASTSR